MYTRISSRPKGCDSGCSSGLIVECSALAEPYRALPEYMDAFGPIVFVQDSGNRLFKRPAALSVVEPLPIGLDPFLSRVRHNVRVYPALALFDLALGNRNFPSAGRTPDQQDAFAIAKWLQQADVDGSLESSSALSLNRMSGRRPRLKVGFSEFCSAQRAQGGRAA